MIINSLQDLERLGWEGGKQLHLEASMMKGKNRDLSRCIYPRDSIIKDGTYRTNHMSPLKGLELI